MRVEAALGLGGNLGDPVAAFATVLKRLERHAGVSAVRPSSVYRTAPWGRLDQPEFLNMAVLVETTLPARALLDLCLDLEREGGRERRERWGPRTIDIDILTYGGQRLDEPGLQVPHPRIAERAFVLVPLAEIAPELRIEDRAVAELLEAVTSETIRRDGIATDRLKVLLAD